MIKGVLVINYSLKSDKFSELYQWLAKSAYKFNVDLSVISNREITIDTQKFCLSNKDIDFILFWDKDVLLARYLENQGFRVFNNSESIAICDDKAFTHITLCNKGIKMPRTIIPPLTFFDSNGESLSEDSIKYIEEISEKIKFPMIIKARKGSFGAQVHLADNKEELLNIVKQYGINNILFQEYIESSKGRDIRLQVVGDKVVAAMYRYSDKDFRANITNGGKMKKITPSKEAIEMALYVAKELKLDFAGVDILYGEKEEPILCEVNSNAHFINIHKCTGINVADDIIKYIVERVR